MMFPVSYCFQRFFHFHQHILLIVWFLPLIFLILAFNLFKDFFFDDFSSIIFDIGKPELEGSSSSWVVVLLGNTSEIQVSCRRYYVSSSVVLHCPQMHPEHSKNVVFLIKTKFISLPRNETWSWSAVCVREFTTRVHFVLIKNYGPVPNLHIWKVDVYSLPLVIHFQKKYIYFF